MSYYGGGVAVKLCVMMARKMSRCCQTESENLVGFVCRVDGVLVVVTVPESRFSFSFSPFFCAFVCMWRRSCRVFRICSRLAPVLDCRKMKRFGAIIMSGFRYVFVILAVQCGRVYTAVIGLEIVRCRCFQLRDGESEYSQFLESSEVQKGLV